jgi:guanylate kinase
MNPSPERTPAPLVVVSGPSGVGKTTVVDRLLARTRLPLRRAVTATTRAPRAGEVPEVSYHFWSRDEFRAAIDAGRMLEWAEVFGTDLYGTPRSEVDPYRAAGTGVVLVIDVQGAARVRELCPDALSVFITPPSFAELEARLRSRNDMPEDRVRRRLDTARSEVAQQDKFDEIIINRDLDAAVGGLEALIGRRFGPQRGADGCSTT